MMLAVQDITNAGGTAPEDLLLISMFENSLPIAYSVIKQMTRRMNHTTFLAYYTDLLAQTRAELACRAPAVHAFHTGGQNNQDANDAALAAIGIQRLAAPPGAGADRGRGRGRGGGRGRGRSGQQQGGRGDGAHPANPCLNCGDPAHSRNNCPNQLRRCRFCNNGNHLGAFCPKNPTAGARRNALSDGAKAIVDREANSGGTPGAAMSAQPQLQQQQQQPAQQQQPTQQQQQQPAQQQQQPAPQQQHPALSESAAHAAAAAAAAAHGDPGEAAGAYVAALRLLGYGMCASLAMGASASARLQLPGSAGPPPASVMVRAMVDSMATYFVVNRREHLVRITNSNPGFSVLTAGGTLGIEAVGVSHVWVPDDAGKLICYEINNVLLMTGSSAVLYSVRVMRDMFGFKHDFDGGVITMPGPGGSRRTLQITDDGAAFYIPVAFATVPQPTALRSRSGTSAAALLVGMSEFSDRVSAFPADTMGTPQSLLYQRLAFPYAQQWRYVGASTSGHALPPNVVMSGTLPVSDAVMRGRARALPFFHKHPTDLTPPPPGAVIYMDFAGPLLPSFPHGYNVYAGAVDAGSVYGRVLPSHSMKKEVATAMLDCIMTDISSKMKLNVQIKPHVVNSDNGSAFISSHFREFLAARQIALRLSPPYTPQLNGHIEAMWGTTFGTARVLLAVANLPPSMHPFAVQTARWIENRLPKPTRGHQTPVYILSKELPDLSHLYTFGCLCLVTLPKPLRSGDKHFMDRGAPGLYLGPSEAGSCHVVYVFALRRVLPTAKIRVWEDEFPGLRGQPYRWFPDVPVAGSGGAGLGDTINKTTGEPATATSEQPAASEQPSTAPDTAFVPPSPVAPSPRPRVAHPDGDTPVVTPYTPHGTATGGYTPFDPDAGPSTSFGPSAASPGPRVPKTDSADPHDPSSRLFQRQQPTRTSRNSNPVYTSKPGHAALTAAAAVFALFCGLEMHSQSISDRLVVDARTCPAFAFASYTSATDAAFAGFDSSDDDSIVNASEIAAYVFSVTIVSTSDHGDVPIPRGYHAATTGEWKEYWKDAIAKELAGLIGLRTWEYMRASQMPKGSNLMHCHYVFDLKRHRDRSVEKFKARLVADGNTQRHGVDFDRIFSTVVKASTIRLVLVVAAAKDYNLSQIDIRQAYLQAKLNEEIYMRVPPGIHPFDEDGNALVCKLLRSLYGLKQAGREWGMLFSGFLVEWGFVRSSIDTCLFIYNAADGAILWMLVYVDDCLIVDNDGALRSRFIADLGKRFPVDDRGELHFLLGVSIDRDRSNRTIILSQEQYVQDLIDKYGEHLRGHTRKYDSPMEEGLHLSEDDCPAPGSEAATRMTSCRVTYMALVGAFLWLANMTRSEISHAASQLARFVSNPGQIHFNAAIRVLIYLDCTRKRGLTYRPNLDLPLHVLVDSSWDVKFSCSGAYYFFMGCAFHWFSKMQRSVTLSSAEAEFFGAMLALKDTIWLREILLDLGLLLPGPTLMWCDSKSAVDMAFDPVAFKKTKHILRAANFFKDHTKKNTVALQHCKGVIMIADILTKAVARQLFLQLLKLLDDYSINSIIDLQG